MVSRQELDSRVNVLTVNLNNWFQQIKGMQIWLASKPDAELQAEPYLYTATEVAQLKSAFADLDQLRQVYEGTATRTPAYDYRTFAKLVWGLGF